MEFSEKKALQIIEQFKLSPSTLKVWKTRNKIPDAYAKGHSPFATNKKVRSESEMQQSKHILRSLKTGKFYLQSLCRLAGLENTYHVADFIRGKVELNADDFLLLKKAINILRNEIKKFLADSNRKPVPEVAIKQFKILFQRPEISFYVIMERKKEIYTKFYDWSIDKRVFPADHIDFLRGSLLVFLTETTI